MAFFAITYRSRKNWRQHDSTGRKNSSHKKSKLAALRTKVFAKLKHLFGSRKKVELEKSQDLSTELSTELEPNTSSDQRALNIAELLGAIVIHLPICDLTRALLVSIRFNDTIVASKGCRRTLFLEPEGPTYFIEWRECVNQTHCLRYTNEERRFQPVLFYEAGEGRYPITRAHPILANPKDRNVTLESRLVPMQEFNKVQRSTLLCQPPVTKISIDVPDLEAKWILNEDGPVTSLKCDTGVTFDAVVDKLNEMCEACHADSVRIVAKGVVAENVTCVQLARKVLADQLEAGPINPHDQGSAVKAWPPLS